MNIQLEMNLDYVLNIEEQEFHEAMSKIEKLLGMSRENFTITLK